LPATVRSRTDAAGTTPADPGQPGQRRRAFLVIRPGDRASSHDTAAAEPRRGVKPRKEHDGALWQHAAPSRTTSRIKASKVTASVLPRSHRQRCGRVRVEEERQGGTGAGDRVAAVRGWCPSRGGSACGECLGSWETDFTIRNAANPRTGCRVQQTCEPSRGENRRGGEKPRGRNGTSKLVASRPMVASVTGSGRAADVSVEGRRAGARRVTVWCTPTPREEAGLPAGAMGGL